MRSIHFSLSRSLFLAHTRGIGYCRIINEVFAVAAVAAALFRWLFPLYMEGREGGGGCARARCGNGLYCEACSRQFSHYGKDNRNWWLLIPNIIHARSITAKMPSIFHIKRSPSPFGRCDAIAACTHTYTHTHGIRVTHFPL